MADPVTLGKAQAVGMLAYVRGSEVGGVNDQEGQGLIAEYHNRRGAIGNPMDIHEFAETLKNNLSGYARDVLGPYLDPVTAPIGQTAQWVGGAHVRAVSVLGFARGVEASFFNRYGEIERDFWGNAMAIDGEERGALKSEFYDRRAELTGPEQQQFRQILDQPGNLSPEAQKAIRSFWD